MTMKRYSGILLVVLFGLVGIFLGLGLINLNKNTPAPAATMQTQPSSPELRVEDIIAEPQTLEIPGINVSALVESVGQDSEGKMDVPKGVFNVAWYNLGYKPGEKGSAVMAGHLDTASGAPAVFYNIRQLQPGDEVRVTDKNGKTLTYEVTRVQSYAFDKVPLQEIFASQDKPRLNLITCVGTWDVGTRNYSERLVVYTELKS